ncbi:hypothetical protein Tco_0707298 [Tanacetum coccineum]|uniref:Uncharacterized protein n=1 Tax=Tanacetum coccineum TaxID=301880 RepID=A0ABQ4YC20_9ASTR
MTFKVLLHHYGRFTSPPHREFVDELIATIDPVDIDTFSANQVAGAPDFRFSYSIDLSRLLIPNEGSLEESCAVGAVETNNMMYVTVEPSDLNIPRMKIADLETIICINIGSNPENVRLTVIMKLQEALDEEAILEEQMLALMHRFADRFTDRRIEINNLMVLQDHALVDYAKYALGCMTGADMKKCVYLKSVRDELLRSMEEKRQLMANYRDM